MPARRTLLFAAALGTGIVSASARPAQADGTAPNAAIATRATGMPGVMSEPLMIGLAKHAARFEEMKRRGAFTMTGHVEELDSNGRPSVRKDVRLRSTPTRAPMDRITQVLRYTENGEDKTLDAQKRLSERRAKRLGDADMQAEDRKRDIKLPFLASEQGRYVFTVVERDAAQPSRVRVAFAPKVPAENAIKGSAWVDESEREVLTVGFSLSKNPTFIDHVDITIVFGLVTELGRAPSQVSFDGRGGFLFVRKHYRGEATLSEPRAAF